MKKFYIPIFAAVFLLSSFLSQGQTTYNSITSNPLGYTLDDFHFWQGGVPPPNPCNDCTINIFANVTMVPENGGLAANGGVQTTAADGAFLNDVVVSNSTINIYGATTLTINTYVEFFNAVFTLGNDPSSPESISFNDQLDLNGTSSIQIANQFGSVNALEGVKTTILGPHTVGPHAPIPGIFTIRTAPAPVGATDFTLNDFFTGRWDGLYDIPGNNYTLNCDGANPLNTCTPGIVYGPAKTAYDAVNDFFGFGQSVTLPVVLVQFIANREDDGSVLLNWSTSQEQNSSYYDVERSGDQTAWTKIGSVKAKGYSSTTTNYNFSDKLPLDGGGYYRLKMVDLDGKYKYSKTVAVNSPSNSQALVVYSNPFSDQIRLKINVSRAQNLIMTVSDMLGKTYINQNYHAQSGDNFVNLLPAAGGSGMYILRIHGDSYDQTVKLEKQ
jgi:hypothetical protein